MNEAQFKELKVGDRIQTRADCNGTITRIDHEFATVHFDGDPITKTFTTWASVIVKKVDELDPEEVYRQKHHDLINHINQQVNLLCILIRKEQPRSFNSNAFDVLDRVSTLLCQASEIMASGQDFIEYDWTEGPDDAAKVRIAARREIQDSGPPDRRLR